MAKLILKFEEQMLKEVPIGGRPITIGRGPDNDIPIDNLAVSTHHAKIFVEEGRLMIEDLDSLNGTFVNNQRVQRAALKHGDSVLIGKHHLILHDVGEAEAAPAPAEAQPKVAAPKVSETLVLDTKARKELLQQALAQQAAAAAPGAREGAGTQLVTPPRVRVPSLVVIAGSTDQKEYLLSSKLTMIGKSELATIRLKGWFKPKVAAQINKRDDGYYLAKADKVPNVNGQPITGPTKLNEGDLIEVAGVRLNFVYRD